MVLFINFFRLIVPWAKKPQLFVPLYNSFLIFVLLILVQLSWNLWITLLSQEVSRGVNHTLLIKREGELLQDVVSDEKRTFIATGKLQQSKFSSNVERINTLLQNKSNQIQKLEQIKVIYAQWQNQLQNRKLLNRARNYTLEEDALFNNLHDQIHILLLHEDVILNQRQDRLDQLHKINLVVDILLTILILVGVVYNVRLLYQRVAIPLGKLTQAGEKWRNGQMETQVGYSSDDEIGQLTRVLNTMATQTRDRQEWMRERNQQFETLISALSHDIRSPLLASRNTLDAMLKGAFGPIDDTWKEVLQEYRQSNVDLLKLVEVLLDVSRYEAGCDVRLDYEPLDWEMIFVKVIAQIKTSVTSEIRLVCQIAESLPIIYGDTVEIRRVLQNLVENAVRVSVPSQKIFLEVASYAENQVKVSVRDQGVGISPQEKERLFCRFTQGRTHRGKSGLGLYLCRQIIEAHGGSIGVESSPGKGSTFWFILPVNQDKIQVQCENMYTPNVN